MFHGIKQLIFFNTIYLFSSPVKKDDNSMLILKLDAIGDYILFRNFIKEIKLSPKYKDFKITLVGNIIWKELAEKLDGHYVDKFIWIDLSKIDNIAYKYKKINEIRKKNYELIINPVYSREFYTMDLLIKNITGEKKIGSDGNYSNIKRWQKKIGDRYYDELITVDNNIMFEFYRNKLFFEKFLSQKLEIKKPYIEIENMEFNLTLPEDYSIIFLGAGSKIREWHISKYLKVAEYIKRTYDLNIILCGSKSSLEDAEFFENNFDDDCINLVGKTSLIDIVTIINNGKIMVSNETSAPHFGIALSNIQVIVISNGNNLGRFTPYPEEMTDKYHVIYHPDILENFEKYKIESEKYGFKKLPDINEIDVNEVNNIIDKVMKKVK